MKYGLLFFLLSILIFISAVRGGGWRLMLLWPSLSLALVGAAYLGLGHTIFGKRADGSMSIAAVAVLFPYLAFLWSIWHVQRVVSREPILNEVTEQITIGRRLLSHELPTGTKVIVDLTCEFAEPTALRSAGQYISFPILDAAVLPNDSLAALARRLSEIDDRIFIHCAQGHGRTGLIAALLLIARGIAVDPQDAITRMQAVRPGVKLNRVQMSALRETSELLQATATPLL